VHSAGHLLVELPNRTHSASISALTRVFDALRTRRKRAYGTPYDLSVIICYKM